MSHLEWIVTGTGFAPGQVYRPMGFHAVKKWVSFDPEAILTLKCLRYTWVRVRCPLVIKSPVVPYRHRGIEPPLRGDDNGGILVPTFSLALVLSSFDDGNNQQTDQLSIGFSPLFVAVSCTYAHLDRNSEWLITFVNLPVTAL